jgi:aryl-alcohol dehydrogenase-like predicted oxidoreductase
LPELETTVTALALAWVAQNPNTSTVILGASKPEQIIENLKAIEVIPKLTSEVMQKIEKILGNKPEDQVCLEFLAIRFIVHFFTDHPFL